MPTCFVIQPFDSGKFDKRFEDVYKPAIEAAGLEAYRVDRDPGVDVPIEAIEEGIRKAAVCLADITTNNPNVWYELGYAFAARRPVLMFCSEERAGKYPFDIQHRKVISYAADAPRDFEQLRTQLTARIAAIMEKGNVLRKLAEAEKVAPVEGLTQQELLVLAAAARSVTLPEEGAELHSVKRDVEQAGLTNIDFSLGIRQLRNKDFIETSEDHDRYGNTYYTLVVKEEGWNWIESNLSKFTMIRWNEEEPPPPIDDDIPF